jgi:hypothetical protein
MIRMFCSKCVSSVDGRYYDTKGIGYGLYCVKRRWVRTVTPFNLCCRVGIIPHKSSCQTYVNLEVYVGRGCWRLKLSVCVCVCVCETELICLHAEVL